jgi:hypothetical protein
VFSMQRGPVKKKKEMIMEMAWKKNKNGRS